MLSQFCIRRPIFASVLSILIVIAGLVASRVLPLSQYPDISPPSVSISTSYEGADAQTLARTVAAPIEDQLSGIEGLQYYTTSIRSNGDVRISCVFEVGTDPNDAMLEINNRVRTAERRLPETVRQNGVTVRKRSEETLLMMALTSPDGSMNTTQLADYANLNMVDDLKRIPGVGDVSVFGNVQGAMRIWLNPDKMAQLGVTVQDVENAVDRQNRQYAAGQVGAAPTTEEQQLFYSITTDGQLLTPEEFGNIVLRSDTNGGLLRLKDVAEIKLGATSYSGTAFYNGNVSSGAMINLGPGANAMSVATKVKSELERMKQFFPDGVDYAIVFDTTVFINATVDEVVHTIFEAFILVLLTVYLSLGTWRATLIPAVAVPVSLIGTFIFMGPFGISANTISLLSIVLVIGIVVDDAIMVVENVERVISEEPDMPIPDCVAKAMSQITAPIIAITLVILSVFVPVAFIPGITGQLYKQFAITVSCSMLISALNALTLSPALCAVMLRHEEKPTRGLVPWCMAQIDRARDGYTNTVRRLVRHSSWSILIIIGVIAAALGLNKITPAGFLPDEDQGVFMVDVQLPEGASQDRTKEILRKVFEITKSHPAVDKVMMVSGQ